MALICGRIHCQNGLKISKIPEFKFLGFVDNFRGIYKSRHAVIAPIPVHR